MPPKCPGEPELNALLTGNLPENERMMLENHLQECPACRKHLDLLLMVERDWLEDVRAYVKADSTGPESMSEDSGQSVGRRPITIQPLPPDPLLGSGAGGRRLGDYEILAELGRGGMGVVFRAWQQSLQREVALKVILAGQFASATQLRRFQVEAEASAKLDHPHIVPIYDIGQYEGRHYFSMKLIEGLSLKEGRAEFQASSVASGGSVEWIQRERKVARLMATISRATHHAHQRGILHRDLKPANVLLDGKGEPHLTDFGLAKLVQVGSELTVSQTVLGTPEYISPEQASGQTRMITTASDIYSLGVILYELVAGRVPFEGDDLMSVLNRVLHEEPVAPRQLNPALSRDLETICLKCLQKEPVKRFHSAESLAEELERFARGESIRSRPISAPEKVWRWCRRKPALAGALAALVFVIISGISGVVWKWRDAVAERRRTEEALTNLEVEKGLQAGNSSWGLAQLGALLRQQSTNEVVAERLINALSYRTFCVPVAPLQHGKALDFPQTQLERGSRGLFPFRSEASVVCVDFSRDGRLVLTGSRDGTVRLWDGQTGAAQGEPFRHEAPVLWAKFSPDENRVLTVARDGRARTWEVATRHLMVGPWADASAVRYADFTPDGRGIITASDDGTVQIWDLESGKRIGTPLSHPNPVYYAAYSMDGRQILTVERQDRDGPPGHLWDAQTGKRIAGLPHHFRPEVRNPFPCFSPSSDLVLVFNGLNGLLFSSRTARGDIPEPLQFLNHSDAVICLAFSPDSRRAATGSHDATVRLWTTNGQPVSRMAHGGSVNSVQFSVDGEMLLTASRDQTAQLWNAGNGQPLSEPLRHETAVLEARLGPDNRRLATISETDCAWLWEVRRPGSLTRSMTASKGLAGARFSADGKIILSLTRGSIMLWDAATGQQVGMPFTPPRPQQILDAALSPDGRYLSAALELGNTLLWDLKSSNRKPPMPFLPPGARDRDTIRCVRFSPDSQRIVTGSDRGITRIWKIDQGLRLFECMHGARVNHAEFNPAGDRIVTASWDRTAQLWDARTGAPCSRPLTHDGEVNWAIFDPTGKRVATASRDKTVRLWSASTGESLMHPLSHADALAENYPCDFSYDGSRLATVAGNALQLWEVESGRPLIGPLRQSSLILSVRFSPDARRIVTAANDGVVLVWDARTGYLLGEPFQHGARATYAEFSPDGKWIVTSSWDDEVRIRPVLKAARTTPGWLPDLAEALAGQSIDQNGVSHAVPVLNLYRLRSELLASTNSDYYSRWGRWFFAENKGRSWTVQE